MNCPRLDELLYFQMMVGLTDDFASDFLVSTQFLRMFEKEHDSSSNATLLQHHTAHGWHLKVEIENKGLKRGNVI